MCNTYDYDDAEQCGVVWSVCREEIQAGIRRRYEIATHGIDVWHVLEYEHYKLSAPSHGQFHAGDTYVIRWNYSTLQTGGSLGGIRKLQYNQGFQ